MNYSWELIKIFLYLAVITGIILVVARILKRGYYQHNQGKYMEIVEQIYLGHKKQLSLVKIKNKIVLFSVTGENIEKISEWPITEFEDLELNKTENFKNQLKKYIKGNWRDSNE